MKFNRSALFATLVAVPLAMATAALAQSYGSAQEARAMLDRAVASLKADQAKALEMFTKGEGGFKDRDLYPFCGGPDGMFTAHPSLVGKSLRDLQDKATPPKALGSEIYSSAKEGAVAEVSYSWPRPGDATATPVKKVAFVTKVGDQVCAVGYYPQ